MGTLGSTVGHLHQRASRGDLSTGRPPTLPSVPTDASAALQVRAVKDYCNNYDLTSLNVKAGDVITVSVVAQGWGDIMQVGRHSPAFTTPCP